jgi:parallel beta-helix repeat protein/predicted outer membrane repeat protein
MKRLKTTIIWLLAALITNSAVATVRYVPDHYPTIQAAVNACSNGDTVVVEPGIYTGSSNRDITFDGKSITVRSIDPADPNVVNSTVIDCNGQGRGFIFYLAEGADSTVSGLTITNGYAFLGGAVYCYNNSSPSIINCAITGNSAVFGGAIACANSDTRPRISNCTITANSAIVGGGAIYCSGASPEIRNCVIIGNSSLSGGAIYSHNAGNPVIANCTISGNSASNSAGGIYCYASSNLTIGRYSSVCIRGHGRQLGDRYFNPDFLL